MERDKQNLLHKVLTVVSEETGVPELAIVSRSRKRPASDARKIYCNVIWYNKEMDFSLREIGEIINRDHSDVIHNRDRADDIKITDREFRMKLNKVRERFNLNNYNFLIETFENIPQL